MKQIKFTFFALAASIFALDQACKKKIEAQPPQTLPRKLGQTSFTLHRSHNRGMFMNLMEDKPKAAGWLSSATLALFSFFYLPSLWQNGNFLRRLGAGLVIGGALSNVYDHLKRGFVVDYISLPFKPIRHIIFNIGDFSIFAGLAALLWDSLWTRS